MKIYICDPFLRVKALRNSLSWGLLTRRKIENNSRTLLLNYLSEAGGPSQHPELTSQTDRDSAAIRDEFEATKETPQYWDIKF